jgi:DNA-binding transcriptional regulator YiaG
MAANIISSDHKESIRSLRKSLGLTTVQFGHQVGVTKRTVEGWEQGRNPSKSAKIIMKVLYNFNN